MSKPSKGKSSDASASAGSQFAFPVSTASYEQPVEVDTRCDSSKVATSGQIKVQSAEPFKVQYLEQDFGGDESGVVRTSAVTSSVAQPPPSTSSKSKNVAVLKADTPNRAIKRFVGI